MSDDERKQGGLFGASAANTWGVIAGIVALLAFLGFTPNLFGWLSGSPYQPPTSPTLPPWSPPAPTVTIPVTTTITPAPSPITPVSEELVGSWRGGGSQYAYDNFYQSLEITFTAEGEYSKTTGGVLYDAGRFEVNGSLLVFRPAGGQPYIWNWGINRFAGNPVLNLLNSGGGTYSLDKI